MDTFDCLKLDNQLCFPLYACSREIGKLYTPYLEPLNLTYTQYVTMMALWEHKVLSVKEMGRLLYLDSGTLTPVLKKLEEKGYVNRRRSREDERSLIVSLTEAGETLKERAAEIPYKMAENLKLSMDDAKKLYELLYKLLNTFQP